MCTKLGIVVILCAVVDLFMLIVDGNISTDSEEKV